MVSFSEYSRKVSLVVLKFILVAFNFSIKILCLGTKNGKNELFPLALASWRLNPDGKILKDKVHHNSTETTVQIFFTPSRFLPRSLIKLV